MPFHGDRARANAAVTAAQYRRLFCHYLQSHCYPQYGSDYAHLPPRAVIVMDSVVSSHRSKLIP